MSESPISTPETAPRATALWTRIAITLIVLLAVAVGAQWLRPKPASAPITVDSLAEGAPLAGSSAPVVGQTAPDFEMLYADGRRVRLSDLRGQPVIVNFWATWCGPCQIEMPELVRAYDTYAEEKLVILAVDVEESADVVQPFAKKFDMRFPIVLDSAGKISDEYQVRNFPSSLFIDRQGMIAARWVGILSREQLERNLWSILARSR